MLSAIRGPASRREARGFKVLARFLTHEYKAKPAPRRPWLLRRTLPDFRNLGVVLRILLLVNGLALVAGLIRNREWVPAWR
jgi:hypothetical protein